MKKSILEVLKERRISCGKTQKELASEIFKAQHTLSGYETGKKIIGLDKLEDIAKKLDGEIKFIPNEVLEKMRIEKNIRKCYLENIIVFVKDDITKELLNTEEFKCAFNKFSNAIWAFTGFTDSLGCGTQKIFNLASNQDKSYLNTKTKEIDLDELNNSLKSTDALKINLIPEQKAIVTSDVDISIQLLNLSDNLDTDRLERISKLVYEFISEYIEDNLLVEYENYEETSDWFILKRQLELFEEFSDERTIAKTEIFIY